MLAFAGRLWLTTRYAAPQLLCDEFIYARVARSIAETGRPELRGSATHQNLLYPALIAPGWLAGPVSTAYTAAKTINVIAMTAGAGVVYAWSRRLVTPLFGLAAAALVLAMPWFEYSALLMTENLFMPLFLGACFAAACTLERPAPRLQLLTLALIALACLTRTQGLVLIPMLATAIGLYALLGGAVPLRAWWPSAAVLGGAAAVYVVWVLARGDAWSAGLGDYSVILHWHRTAGDVVHWAWRNGAAITLTSGIVPLAGLVALAIAVAARRAEATPAERALVAVALAAALWVAVQVGIFATEVVSVVERYAFYVEPLLFLSLATFLARERPYRRLAAAAGGVVALVLAAAVPARDYATSILPNNVGLYGVYDLTQRFGGADRVRTLIVLAAAASVLLLALLPRRWAAGLLVAVGLWLAYSSVRVHTPMAAQAATSAAILGADRSWIDDAVGRGARVTYLYAAPPQDAFEATRLSLETEFWNRSVRSVTGVEGRELCGMPERPATLVAARDGTRIEPEPAEPLAATGAPAFVPLGPEVGHGLQQAVYRPNLPLRLDQVSGLTGDRWTGASAEYVHTGHAGGTLVVELSREWPGPPIHSDVTVTAATTGDPYWTRRWSVGSSGLRSFRIPLPHAPTRVRIEVTPTFSPADYGRADTRQLGVQARFLYVSTPRGPR